MINLVELASSPATPDSGYVRVYAKNDGLLYIKGDDGVEHVVSFDLTPLINAAIPPGTMLDYAGGSVQTGFLLCDGSNVSRTTYVILFDAIGTLWGVGDGSTTFTLPDSRRRASVGSGGTGTGTLGNAVGNTGGAETVTLTISEIPSHNHTINRGSTTGGSGNVHRAGTFEATETLNNATGGGGAHNNLPPSMVVTKMIRTGL